MVDFGSNAKEATVALCAALVAIVVWATLAWKFGIPTSESHALIAGLTGAAIAMHGGLGGVNGAEWLKVIYGLFLSTLLGFGFGFFSVKLTEILFKKQIVPKQRNFSREHRSAEAHRWHLCTARRTVRNLWGFFSSESFSRRAKQE